jgi:hypothetical protein
MRRLLPLLALSLTVACGEDAPAEKTPAKKADAGKADKPKAEEGYKPVQAALEGEPRNALLLSQAWFYKEGGKPKPGPARLQIWREGEAGWESSLLEDAESNVFHKTIITGDRELVTIGAEGAHLKRWTFADGKWSSETLWTKSWGGKFNRLRDIEIGDVDGDGEDEWVIATHDAGVVAVGDWKDGKLTMTELDQKADTFVHEIEIGDIDGDGKLEFFATPSDRNKANASQPGWIVMYKFDGTTYKRTEVDGGDHTHAKEILATDFEGDGTSEFMSVLEAETGPNKEIKEPVKIRLYKPNGDGTFSHEDIARIDDRQTRFVLAADFDGDGRKELVAAAMKTGLYFIDSEVKGKETTWSIKKFDSVSSGFEHATVAHDMDGDGTPELYVAADDQRELKKYTWNAEKGTFDKKLLGRLNESTITWNVVGGKL